MIRTDIIQKLTESGFLITQEAVVTIQETDMPLDLVNEILKYVDESVVVIGQPHVTAAKESLNSQKKVVRSSAFLPQTDDESADVLATVEVGGTGVANGHAEPHRKLRPITVLADITESSTCVGTYEEFVRYFRNRYDRLSEIIRKRLNSRPIESLTYWNRRREGWFDDEGGTSGKISIIGLVNETRDTPNGHRVLELEDPTGYFSGIALKNKGAYDAALQVVLDEVVGITGSLASDGKVLFIDNITWPDIPPQHQPTHAENDVHVALTSDIHIGSKTFLTSAWKDFAEWIASSEDERAQKIAYVIVAGDVVDGIGVFPNQEDELAIDDIDD
ncbi:MAG: hypothetical protein ACXV2E_03565, partial [Halobacteriota archaeon]